MQDYWASEVQINLYKTNLVTKMSDMTRFEVILTSFSSDECNGQFKFKIKWFVTSANELVRAR